jgi:hypothetical protein
VLADGITAAQPVVGALLTPSAVLPGLFRLNISAELSPVDSTAPITTISLSPPAPNGSNGWYTEPVTVSVSAEDSDGSGVAETRCMADPATPPSQLSDFPPGCPYLGAGADVASEGHHEIYAASENNSGNDETPIDVTLKLDQTPPTVTCTEPTPTFQFGSAGGPVTATVNDDGSGPVSTSASATTAGVHTINLTGQDAAGNATTVACPYVVAYTFAGFLTPLPKTTINSGSTLPLKFQLQDANGHPIDGTEAQSLLSPSCKIAIILINPAGPLSGCPRYDPISQQYQFNLKTIAAIEGTNGVSITVTLGDTVVTTSPVDTFTVSRPGGPASAKR